MNKKFFAGLFIISLLVFAGGCGNSNGPLTGAANINSALRGLWSSSTNGTAEITNTNTDEIDFEALQDVFGEISSDVLDQYKQAKENENSSTVNAPVINAMVFFDDCNVQESSGSAKLTAFVILSGDSLCLPIFYNNVAISTQRNNTNEWTLTIPDGGTLSINMTSEDKINFSGNVHYLDYDCEFNTTIEKNAHNTINPQEILDGVWKLDDNHGGGYLAVNSNITSAVYPRAVSMYFDDTKQEVSTLTSSVTSFYSLSMTTSNTKSNEDASVLQMIYPAGTETLTQVFDNVYKFQEENGEGILFVENTDEIFLFMTENGENNWQTSMFLPLKKIAFDLESMMNKTWTAFDGGGYMNYANADNPNNDPDIELMKRLDNFSFTLQSGRLSFSNAAVNDDDTITMTLSLNTTFSMTNNTLDSLLERAGISSAPVNISDTWETTMTVAGNFLRLVDDDNSVYDLAFISENEAVLSIASGENSSIEGNFVLRFKAN